MAGPVPERTGSPIRDTANYLVVVSKGGTGKPTVCAHADLKVMRTFGRRRCSRGDPPGGDLALTDRTGR